MKTINLPGIKIQVIKSTADTDGHVAIFMFFEKFRDAIKSSFHIAQCCTVQRDEDIKLLHIGIFWTHHNNTIVMAPLF